ncbi:uncharacterized protein LOC112638570 [Camponotus floridanus]|uniref:uncharacterized protein LOC112638570 n=1 Tax=Camponotus floridanus TaxID=104421 RepID=UPI000DC6B35E|nr:uncharacterized protein LOC112638570 [Camponotus floridanus]
MNFLQNAGAGNSGNGKVKKPAFYDEASPTPTTSKEQPATTSNATNSARQSATNAMVCESENALSDEDDLNESPFNHVKSSTKPKKPRVDNSCILNFLKNEAEERRKQNESLMKLMQDSNDTKKVIFP